MRSCPVASDRIVLVHMNVLLLEGRPHTTDAPGPARGATARACASLRAGGTWWRLGWPRGARRRRLSASVDWGDGRAERPTRWSLP